MPHVIESVCNGCTACARQCPTRAIRGSMRGLHVIEPRLCIDCGVCGLICPVEAVVSQAGERVRRVPRDRREHPGFDADVCNGCGLCVDFCPFDCLEVDGPLHRSLARLARPLACVSCGECVFVCLKGAVVMAPR